MENNVISRLLYGDIRHINRLYEGDEKQAPTSGTGGAPTNNGNANNASGGDASGKPADGSQGQDQAQGTSIQITDDVKNSFKAVQDGFGQLANIEKQLQSLQEPMQKLAAAGLNGEPPKQA